MRTRSVDKMKHSVQINPLEKFQSLVKLLSAVPKAEVDSKEAEYQRRRRETKNRKQK